MPTRQLRRVLVCDHDRAVRSMLRRLFTRDLSAEVDEAANGLAALEAMLLGGVPDLLVLELLLPELNGLETLRTLRGTPALAQLPVIVLTAESSADTVRQVIQLGVIDYVAKPLSVGTWERVRHAASAVPDQHARP